MANRASDPLTAAEIEILGGLDPAFKPMALRARQAVLEAGIPFVFISGRRSRTLQDTLGKVNALAVPAGKSKHEIGWAFDWVGFRSTADAVKAGKIIAALGLESGALYKNDPQGKERGHVEHPGERADLFAYSALTLVGIAAAVGIAVYFTKE